MIPSSCYSTLLMLLALFIANRETHAFGGLGLPHVKTTTFATTASTTTTSTVTTTSSTFTTLYASRTIEAPVREKEKTDRKVRRPDQDKDKDNVKDDQDNKKSDYPDLEYLQDTAESREMEDPFHILLMGATFEKPKITVPYVAGSLEYVLNMPSTEATELAGFAEEEGMSCLGTWPREECLTLGKQLQVRDIVCRVVPYAQGGQRGWQAKDANDSSNDAYSNSGSGGGMGDSDYA
jgi:hypothetical protein